jgi:hypothetical protein
MEKARNIGQMIIFTLVLIILFSCDKSQKPSFADEKEKILDLHKSQRDYHFKKDSIAFVNQLSENFISVNKGVISVPRKSETVARYNNYFSSVAFIKWDDVSDPIVRFSDDGSMAYTLVDKIVVLSYQNEYGTTVEEETHFAWTAIYKKYGDDWKIDCVTSTERPKAK